MLPVKIWILTFLTFFIVNGLRNDDEHRPYEFGFTIDGEQHRHEKKDANGIIQGEFGFITADGIYHVTVYATDENGNFKILSMRNVRISAPLDGSPLPPGQTIHANPSVKTKPMAQAQPLSQPIPQQPISTTTQGTKTTFLFTTQPTIKPACAGCGYVTTPKPKPGQLFPFQTPTFQKPTQQQPNLLNPNPSTGAITNHPPSINSGNSSPDNTNPSNHLNNFTNSPKYPNPSPPPSAINNPNSSPVNGPIYPSTADANNTIYPNSRPVNAPTNLNSENETSPTYPNSSPVNAPTYPNSDNANSPIYLNSSPANAPTHPNSDNANSPIYPNSNPVNAPIYPNSETGNEVASPPRPKPLLHVSIDNGVIHVPGNQDIPIKDKYPGMVDGLPDGINEKDITDLLYKFNYTVGFHGHYEKGLKNGAKIGGYFVNGRDGVSRIVTYVADENGFRPKVRFVRLDLASDDVPKEGTEKMFGLKNFEFVWYPIS